MTTSENKFRPELDIYPNETNLCFDPKDTKMTGGTPEVRSDKSLTILTVDI